MCEFIKNVWWFCLISYYLLVVNNRKLYIEDYHFLPGMKAKISIAMDMANLEHIEALVRTGKFRNKSHMIEYAVMRFLEDSHAKQ